MTMLKSTGCPEKSHIDGKFGPEHSILVRIFFSVSYFILLYFGTPWSYNLAINQGVLEIIAIGDQITDQQCQPACTVSCQADQISKLAG